MLFALVEWELGSWMSPGKGKSTKKYVETFSNRKEAVAYMKKNSIKSSPGPLRLRYVVRCL